MAIKFETLKSYMPSIGLPKNMPTPENEFEGKIVASFSLDFSELPNNDNEINFFVLISLQERGEFVQIRIDNIIDKDRVLHSKFIKELSLYLLKLNYQLKIGRWCLDNSDGHLYLDWSLPIEDNSALTETQIKRIMGALISTLRNAFPALNYLLKYGTETAPKNANELRKEIVSLLFEVDLDDEVVNGIIRKVKSTLDNNVLAQILQLVKDKNFDEVRRIISQ